MDKTSKMAVLSLAILLASTGCTNVNNSKQENKDCYMTENDTTERTSSTFIDCEQTEWETTDKGVQRQILGYNKSMMMVKVKFEKGAEGTPHSHKHTQTTYVESGKFEFTIGDEKRIVEKGDGIYIRPDIMHGCVCLEEGMLIDCFSPMRDDFLK